MIGTLNGGGLFSIQLDLPLLIFVTTDSRDELGRHTADDGTRWSSPPRCSDAVGTRKDGPDQTAQRGGRSRRFTRVLRREMSGFYARMIDDTNDGIDTIPSWRRYGAF